VQDGDLGRQLHQHFVEALALGLGAGGALGGWLSRRGTSPAVRSWPDVSVKLTTGSPPLRRPFL